MRHIAIEQTDNLATLMSLVFVAANEFQPRLSPLFIFPSEPGENENFPEYYYFSGQSVCRYNDYPTGPNAMMLRSRFIAFSRHGILPALTAEFERKGYFLPLQSM